MTDTLSRTNETDSLEEKGINELNLSSMMLLCINMKECFFQLII